MSNRSCYNFIVYIPYANGKDFWAHNNILVVCEPSLVMKMEETIIKTEGEEEEEALPSYEIKEEIYVFILCDGREPIGEPIDVIGRVIGIILHKVRIILKSMEVV